jgi:hypothetical protein
LLPTERAPLGLKGGRRPPGRPRPAIKRSFCLQSCKSSPPALIDRSEILNPQQSAGREKLPFAVGEKLSLPLPRCHDLRSDRRKSPTASGARPCPPDLSWAKRPIGDCHGVLQFQQGRQRRHHQQRRIFVFRRHYECGRNVRYLQSDFSRQPKDGNRLTLVKSGALPLEFHRAPANSGFRKLSVRFLLQLIWFQEFPVVPIVAAVPSTGVDREVIREKKNALLPFMV